MEEKEITVSTVSPATTTKTTTPNTNNSDACDSIRNFRILTVGDGDLTLSLALCRAYNSNDTDDNNNTNDDESYNQRRQVDVIASTLLESEEELCQTYKNSKEVIEELKVRWNVPIYYGVDATQLHKYFITSNSDNQKSSIECPDLILFHHPHLGLSTSIPTAITQVTSPTIPITTGKIKVKSENPDDDDAAAKANTSCNSVSSDGICRNHDKGIFLPSNDFVITEQENARRHFVLLAHYFYSAKQLLLSLSSNNNDNATAASPQSKGISTETCLNNQIHVCLCQNQQITWRMEEAANMQELQLTGMRPTSEPFHHHLIPSHFNIQDVKGNNSYNYSAPRRYRNGKFGSKHFLGKYGYRHRRTHGDNVNPTMNSDMNVTGSMHYVFTLQQHIEGTHHRKEYFGEIIKDDVKDGTGYDPQQQQQCCICGTQFSTKEDLERHMDAPALPDPMSMPPSTTTTIDKIDRQRPTKTKYTDAVRQTHANGDDVNKQIKKAKKSKQVRLGLSSIEGIMAGVTPSKWVVSKEDIDEHKETNVGTGAGLRLRWYLQHKVQVGDIRFSKKQNEAVVKNGFVKINDTVVLDSSRFLYAGDIVSLTTAGASTPVDGSNKNNTIDNNDLEQNRPKQLEADVELLDSLEWIVSKEDTETNNNDNDDNNQNSKKRLRLNHYLKNKILQMGNSCSKKQGQTLIHTGFVSINQSIVRDTGRLLHVGDVISLKTTLLTTAAETANTSGASVFNPTNRNLNSGDDNCDDEEIPIIYSSCNASLLVVLKPVGMRAVGDFNHSTLESVISRQKQQLYNGHHAIPNLRNNMYQSISNLDTGCCGLCVLISRNCNDCRSKIDAARMNEKTTAAKLATKAGGATSVAIVNSGTDKREGGKEKEAEKRGDSFDYNNYCASCCCGGGTGEVRSRSENQATQQSDSTIDVKYIFTALVHGHVPKEWGQREIIPPGKEHGIEITSSRGSTDAAMATTNADNDVGGFWARVPWEAMRQWKRRKQTGKENRAGSGDDDKEQEPITFAGKSTLNSNEEDTYSDDGDDDDGNSNKDSNMNNNANNCDDAYHHPSNCHPTSGSFSSSVHDNIDPSSMMKIVCVEKTVGSTINLLHHQHVNNEDDGDSSIATTNTINSNINNYGDTTRPHTSLTPSSATEFSPVLPSTMTITSACSSSAQQLKTKEGEKGQTSSVPLLSTISIATTCRASGLVRAICYYLRKQGFPVVGDRLCTNEYLSLPRYMRNRIKKKLCIGCYSVEIKAIAKEGIAKKHDAGKGQESEEKGESQMDYDGSNFHNNHNTRSNINDDFARRKSHCKLLVVEVPNRLKSNYWQHQLTQQQGKI